MAPSTEKAFELARLGTSVVIRADKAGLRFEAPVMLNRRENWPPDAKAARFGRQTAFEIEQLLELGVAQVHDSAVVVGYEQIADADAFGIDIASRWTPWCPFLLKIDRYSDLGRPDFRYKYEFLRGGRPAAIDRVGCFVRRAGTSTIYRLDSQTYALVEEMDRFNAAGPESKASRAAWLTFARVKDCAGAVGAALDATLQKNDVVVPSSIALSIVEDAQGRLSFVPRCPEVDADDFEHVFNRNDSAEALYSLSGSDGKRVRIVLTERQQEVLQRMKAVRQVTGRQKEQLRSNPAQVFDGLLDSVELPYSNRVVGIGDFQWVPVPRPTTSDSGMGELWHTPETTVPHREVVASHPVGTDSTPAENAVPTGLDGEPLSPAPTEQAPLADSSGPGIPTGGTPPAASGGKRYLLIETNEEQVNDAWLAAATRAASVPEAPNRFERPKALLSSIDLQPHQTEGVKWLQTCVRVPGRTGVLLADDMGLGKTLQILSFLSWAIEAGHFPDLAKEAPPWRPVLVVVPLILLENRTWQNEMERFFENGGSIFLPIASLHGRGIDRFRVVQRAREIEIGKPVLDLDELQRHRIVITNYDTMKNFQHSLAHFRNGKSLWSVVVTDEAQEYKIPNTKISHAVKALRPDFHIACTGTPVENRLLDLWNLFDSVQPGLLRSAREFTSEFEQKMTGEERDSALDRLKQQLLFQRPHAFLLRRSKSEVATLPPKKYIRLRCEMSQDEISQHQELVRTLRRQQDRMSHLAVLQRLSQLYQHPALLRGDADELSAHDLLAQSSKLRKVCEELHLIRGFGQKAIVFARHRVMQTILARTFEAEFRMPVRIINGLTKSTGSGTSSATRAGILEEFRSARGFGVIVLSPFVAGIGLTITEANHVFHYGRWWNPAVEAQATDRAYRIGQTRDVSVYLPILQDLSGQIPVSFDERLDALMESKARLAKEFLRPLDSEDRMADELFEDLARESGDSTGSREPVFAPGERKELLPAYAACVLERRGFVTAIVKAAYSNGIELLAVDEVKGYAVRFTELPQDPGELATVLTHLKTATDAYRRVLHKHIQPALWAHSATAKLEGEDVAVVSPTPAEVQDIFEADVLTRVINQFDSMTDALCRLAGEGVWHNHSQG